MKCPQCHHSDTKVVESRDVAGGESIRRRRECLKCNYRYTTYERIERPHLVVVKKNGEREMFDREKLRAGLQRATEKTPVTSLQLDDLIERVEQRLYAGGDPEVKSRDIGEIVMEELSELNEVAYVRFASVYRSFRSIENFERELSRMRSRQDAP